MKYQNYKKWEKVIFLECRLTNFLDFHSFSEFSNAFIFLIRLLVLLLYSLSFQILVNGESDQKVAALDWLEEHHS